jgi:hypothetical protein
MNTKILTVLGVLAAAGLAAAYFATRPTTPSAADAPSTTPANSLLFPDLAAKADSIAQITVKRAPMEFTIKKDGDAWKVADKANYPAKLDTVRAVIVGLTQLRLSEEKTSRPDQYAKLGVDDPIAPPAASADKPVPQSALVTLKDAAGNPLASAILGNPKYSGAGVGGAATPQMYVRKAGDKATWLASGQVELPREPLGWLESRFADIQRDRIKSVVITHPDNSVVTVSRDKQADPFAVRDIPAGRELKDPGVGESIASTLTGLAFQDVAPVASLIPPPPSTDSNTPPATDMKPGPSIVVRTFDGLIVTVKSVSKDARAWWTLNATIDESLATPPPPPPEAKPGEAVPAAPAAPAVGTLEALKKESSELNASWAPYAFAPADWKVRNINTLLTDLLKEPPKAADAASPTPSPAPPAMPPRAP